MIKAMFWTEEFTEQIKERFHKKIAEGSPLIIRDEKTLSGRVHVGSLRGIVLHGLISQVLTENKVANQFLFELNDNDPMDGLPINIDQEKFAPHMGKPLFAVPPVNEGDENFTTGFGEELKVAVAPMGLPIEWYHLRPLYVAGKFNEVIREALDGAARIREIYQEVSGGGKPDDWFPLNVICPICGKIGTTKVTAWDPSQGSGQVTYECKKNYVKWAEGCGHQGTMSPFDGNATLPWKPEWAAKWKVMGVDIEGGGKDHYAAGGSREVAAKISTEVFNYPTPFDISYEFFNFQGKKMSASKGLGASAKEVSDLLPPKILKFLMIRKEPRQPIDFDPEGKTFPNLFDEYDRCAEHFFNRHAEPFEGYARPFALAQTDLSKEPEDLWEMRFQALSFVVQMPHLDVEVEAAKLKGSALTDAEKSALHERASYVKKWIDALAPAEYKFVIQDSVPADLELSDNQKEALHALGKRLGDLKEWSGETVHDKIHRTKEEFELTPKEIFQPLYRIFMNRKSGPQVGWFLSTLAQEKVSSMLINASSL
ncbi:lysine--tRNA ligase [Candidatus Peregrinibacteria bacterium]|jgi:lysyl-tRNA synthetase, class I|nr:lysine--tRNA ligase [Candidatus Peregrinibacteria bacterium]MBT5468728.1 lysine--tRNA ligase [Candidatus Peregrinibacteria bacterium]MBT7337918.1 lysine--tRNA ligase [Candidatus Peregrinibacteria bacterium]